MLENYIKSIPVEVRSSMQTLGDMRSLATLSYLFNRESKKEVPLSQMLEDLCISSDEVEIFKKEIIGPLTRGALVHQFLIKGEDEKSTFVYQISYAGKSIMIYLMEFALSLDTVDHYDRLIRLHGL